MTSSERSRRWREARRKNLGLCACGEPAVRLKDSNEAVCARCAKRPLDHTVRDHLIKPERNPQRSFARFSTYADTMVDAFGTNGRGWGTLDLLEKQLAAIKPKLPK